MTCDINTDVEMRRLAKSVEEHLALIYGQRMGFFIVAAPFNNADSRADYIGNTKRADGIKWMRDTADVLEAGVDMPAGTVIQ